MRTGHRIFPRPFIRMENLWPIVNDFTSCVSGRLYAQTFSGLCETVTRHAPSNRFEHDFLEITGKSGPIVECNSLDLRDTRSFLLATPTEILSYICGSNGWRTCKKCKICCKLDDSYTRCMQIHRVTKDYNIIIKFTQKININLTPTQEKHSLCEYSSRPYS